MDDHDDKPCPLPDWVKKAQWDMSRLPKSLKRPFGADLAALLLMRAIESETIEAPLVQSVPDHAAKGWYGIALHWQRKNRRVTVQVFQGQRIEIHRHRGGYHPTAMHFRSVIPTGPLREALGWMEAALYTPEAYLEWCDDGRPS